MFFFETDITKITGDCTVDNKLLVHIVQRVLYELLMVILIYSLYN